VPEVAASNAAAGGPRAIAHRRGRAPPPAHVVPRSAAVLRRGLQL